MLKPKKAKLYNPNIVKEISSLCFVRNFKSIPDQDYSFEMTNGLGFDKFLIKAYVLFVGKISHYFIVAQFMCLSMNKRIFFMSRKSPMHT